MSRHRNVKNLDYDEEYDDLYGASYGQSVEDEYSLSPGTVAEFTYGKGNRRRVDSTSLEKTDEVDEDDEDDIEFQRMAKESLTKGLSATDRALLMSCVEQMQSVVGEAISELRLIEAASQANYDPDKALDFVLNQETQANKASKTKITVEPATPNIGSDTRQGAAPGRDLSYDSTKRPAIETTLLTSSLGKRLNFGPGQANTIPDERVVISEEKKPAEAHSNGSLFKTPQVTPVPLTPTTSNNRKSTRNNLSTPVRSQSPASRDGSRRSSPAPAPVISAKEAAKSKTFTPDGASAAYRDDRSDQKALINLVVIGHVDAGKSTLMGRLLFDLGYVSKKSMHRYETDSKKTGKASFLYAWVLDETEEERTRGITMDIAQSRFETKSRVVNLLDAPGHKDFIPNMITGASQADVAILVVDSTKGEFEAGFDAGGQTREHTLLVRSLGVSQLAVVVNKLDNCSWSQERYREIVQKLGQFLKQVGFKDSDVSFVPCSGLIGENLASRSKETKLTSWYDGPCLVEVVDAFRPPERPISKPFRMSVADIFKGVSSGICVSGRIEAGAVQVGQKLTIMPAAEPCTVKAITQDDFSAPSVFAGDHVTITLQGCELNKLTIGSVLCDVNVPALTATRLEARIVVFQSAEVPITKGLPVVIHYNGTTEQATIKKLISQLNKSTGDEIKRRPRCLTKNSSGLVEIEVSRPICVELYKESKELGRFMLRLGGATIAAGLVIKVIS
ncbi:HBS1-like protein [Halotydeus destructor]|nr:HBS1-like protein [Halotydeus destructor]